MTMAMTQRDFEAMAEAMAEARRTVEDMYAYGPQLSRALKGVETATRNLADACAGQYKGTYGFNRDRFFEASGFPELRSN